MLRREPMPCVRLAWGPGGRAFEAIEPDEALIARHAEQLGAWYNAPENATMMDGSGAMSRADVVDFWRELRRCGGRGFLASCDGVLVGDADLRRIDGGAAEFALMIGPASRKGQGLGRALAVMVHVFAFRELGLDRVYVPPRRDNLRVHALNAFLGYERDESAVARAFADGPDCETHSLSAAKFRAMHEDAWRDVVSERVALTTPGPRATAPTERRR